MVNDLVNNDDKLLQDDLDVVYSSTAELQWKENDFEGSVPLRFLLIGSIKTNLLICSVRLPDTFPPLQDGRNPPFLSFYRLTQKA